MIKKTILFILVGILFFSCSRSTIQSFSTTFDNPDRIWVGKNFWSIPLEDWQIKAGRLQCVGKRKNMRVNLLTYTLQDKNGDFNISCQMGLLNTTDINGFGGFVVGLWDNVDTSAKSLCYYGRGLNAGVTNSGFLFVGKDSVQLEDKFDLSEFTLSLAATFVNSAYQLELKATDADETVSSIVVNNIKDIKGLVAIANKNSSYIATEDVPHFWFDNFSLSGSKVKYTPENAFGPILWTMYTNSRNIVKLTAQMPPMGEKDTQTVDLELRSDGWKKIATEKIHPDARTATFRLENWDATKEVEYRIAYHDKNGETQYYNGIICKEPDDNKLVLGGLTCQESSGFPYAPVVKNLAASNPDMLYFSGDQIYEGNGGYSIYRFPADLAVLNYLGKWYMFGWAFGDVMRDRPTICTPDDHDVFQGNLWGESGVNNPPERWQKLKDCSGGFVQPAQMVNAVNRTQCAHLPDPYDPSPLYQNITPFYTDLVYGRISFAIVSDRIYKSGPEHVSYWEGRLDHLQEILPNPDVLEREDLKFLGDRQISFLQDWVTDWRGADMKVLLTQTIFTNSATHHGGDKMFLEGDLDSGGWPRKGRDKAIKLIRKAFAFQIAGDQHIPSLIQYGVEHFRDSNWVFCTPAISVGYERRFIPDDLGWPVEQRPQHGLPNTGYYRDAFGNKNYVYAIGNPVDASRNKPRYIRAQEKASGFGIVRFNITNRTITAEAWPFLSDITKPETMFPGWPLEISQWENYGAYGIAEYFLPMLVSNKDDNPVVMVYEQDSNELVYAARVSKKFTPRVFKDIAYKIKLGYPEQDAWQEKENISPGDGELLFSF